MRAGGKQTTMLAHRLVWEAFNGPIPKGSVVSHLNANRLDNRLSNLEVISMASNIRLGFLRDAQGKSAQEIADMLGVSEDIVRRWLKGAG